MAGSSKRKPRNSYISNQKAAGRPIDITPEMTEDICLLISCGAHPETAAASVGVSVYSFKRWIKHGRTARKKGDEAALNSPNIQKYIDFYEAVIQACARAQTQALATIKAFADGLVIEKIVITKTVRDGELVDTKTQKEKVFSRDWKAAAWLLEHRWRGLWATRAEVTGAKGAALGSRVSVYIPDNGRGDDLPSGNSPMRVIPATDSVPEPEKVDAESQHENITA